MTHLSLNPVIVAQALALASREVRQASSPSDLTRRLANLGYGYRDTPQGRLLTTMPHGIEIGALPQGNSLAP